MAGIDPWGENNEHGLIGPPTHAASVTPNDTDTTSNVPVGTKCLMVGAVGDVKVKMKSGATVTLPNLAAGVWIPMRITHVYSTGTGATEIFAGL